MSAIVICAPLASSALGSEAKRHGHVVSSVAPSAVLASLDRFKPHALVVAANADVLTEQVLRACDARGIRLVALIADDADRRNVAALEIFETVDADAPWSAIETVLVATARVPHTPAAATATRGRVITVWGPAGAPGRSTLAISIAAELAASGHRVALGDADTHAASVAPSLGLLDEAPGFAAACRLAGSESLTRTELERVAQRYPSGNELWVLTGIGRPSRWPELSADRVTATIRECRDWVDLTVLDVASSLEIDEEISSDLFAPRRNAAAIACVREADLVVAVGSADPVGLSRFLRGYVELLELVPETPIIPVINKVRASAIGLGPAAQVRASLARFGGIDNAVLIPHDQSGLDAALLSGRTLAEAAPRSPVRAAVQQLVTQRIVVHPARADTGMASAAARQSESVPV